MAYKCHSHVSDELLLSESPWSNFRSTNLCFIDELVFHYVISAVHRHINHLMAFSRWVGTDMQRRKLLLFKKRTNELWDYLNQSLSYNSAKMSYEYTIFTGYCLLKQGWPRRMLNNVHAHAFHILITIKMLTIWKRGPQTQFNYKLSSLSLLN